MRNAFAKKTGNEPDWDDFATLTHANLPQHLRTVYDVDDVTTVLILRDIYKIRNRKNPQDTLYQHVISNCKSISLYMTTAVLQEIFAAEMVAEKKLYQ